MHTTFSHLTYELQNLSENDLIGVKNKRKQKPKWLKQDHVQRKELKSTLWLKIGPCHKKREG